MHDGNVVRRVLSENVQNPVAYEKAVTSLESLETELARVDEERKRAYVLATNLYRLLGYTGGLRQRLTDALSEPVADARAVADRIISDYRA